MIQRIQTIFLLAAATLQGFYLFNPIVYFTLSDSQDLAMLFPMGLRSQSGNIMKINTPAIFILGIIVLALITIAIFLYKKRILQIRFCVFGMLLNIGLAGMMLFSLYIIQKEISVIAKSYSIWTVVPIANIILLFLAFRGIRKDELLIKAYDRLR